MTYTPYLIAKYATAFDRELQPWLLPDDAQTVLFDGYVYRGEWRKREGYTQLATGQVGGSAYCESRMVHRVNNQVLAAGNGVLLIFDAVLSSVPVRRGTTTISYTIGATPFTAVDNGLGAFTGTNLDGALSTINYTTGAVHLVFTTAPDNATNITATYDAHQGFPVLGVMNFYTAQNTKELIVADTTYVNRYNPATNRLDDITGATYTGTKFNFWSWVNYNTPTDGERLLFVNNKNQIQRYDGTTVTPYPVYTAQGTPITGGAYGVGNGTVGPYLFNAGANTGILPGIVTVTAGAQVIIFNQFGVASGNGTGTIDFLSGNVSVTFNLLVAGATPITIDYTPLTNPIDTCLRIFQLKDRLVIMRPVISGKTYFKRFMISGTGVNGDVFVDSATGAGSFEVPDDSYLVSGDYNRDDLVFYTALSTWILKYTGNDTVPFTPSKLDGSRGSDAPFGTTTYLNTTDTSSTRGFIGCDGYTVTRRDDKIPDFSFNQINQENFQLCFAGNVDADRDHYLLYPDISQIDSSAKSDRILVYNYEELNYSIYRIPLSSMGQFVESRTVTWNDLAIFPTWDAMAAVYSTWNSFNFSKNTPISIGGGHEGQIFELNVAESEDYDVRIYNITYVDATTIQVTTDFQNYQVSDYVLLQNISGIPQLSNVQGVITSVTDPYTFNLNIENVQWDSADYVYQGNGTAYKVIVFESHTKKFNPFIAEDKKVRCGWIYFYTNTTKNLLTDKQYISSAVKVIGEPCLVTVPNNGYTNSTQVQINGVQGMTELNGNSYFITVVDENDFTLNGTEATSFTDYTEGGFCATPNEPKLLVECIVNDRPMEISVTGQDADPFEVNLSDTDGQVGEKKWSKIWINQIGKFVQFKVISRQAGNDIRIQAMMPGFQPVGRLI